MQRADRGLDWSYPCLIWIADYLCDATGEDPAAEWRREQWTELSALRSLKLLASGGEGSTDVERAMDAMAHTMGWIEADGQMQGATMVGVYDAKNDIGVPAIFDGQDRWIISNDGLGWLSFAVKPKRMWEVRT